ncbi:hypothetical protein [Moritella sp. F3]|uniref:hypothetical protein n=1 Tax=Moritella sp. F3 TaxID=2718882 RepID=UPI0018E13858|nr:hypothetical protein [Moritella sp. F3]GIC77678.1 hypothetical protein FMO001_24050 [Moritella sp. F1]GIC82091.1 hypothetical protein FMO003_23720 [Moritella sp. F3]
MNYKITVAKNDYSNKKQISALEIIGFVFKPYVPTSYDRILNVTAAGRFEIDKIATNIKKGVSSPNPRESLFVDVNISTLEELQDFIETHGKVIVDKDVIMIYNDFIE